MQVFVTGGTGAIGRPAVAALVGAGHSVSALARTPDRAAALEAQGARPVAVSLFDREGLALAFAGHDAVVNLATAIPPTSQFMRQSAWADNQRIRTEGSAAVVDAALAAGVDTLVQESVVMVYPDRGAEWIDEDVPPDRYPMAEGNLAAEANARRFTGAGGRGMVLRFGWFHGPGAAHSEELLALARRHVATMLGPADGFVSSIHVADGGAAVAAALAAPAGTWNVVDDEPLTKRAFRRRPRCRRRGDPVDPAARAGRPAAGRPIDLADPLAPRRQREVPRGDGLGAPLPQRPRGPGGDGAGSLTPAVVRRGGGPTAARRRSGHAGTQRHAAAPVRELRGAVRGGRRPWRACRAPPVPSRRVPTQVLPTCTTWSTAAEPPCS